MEWNKHDSTENDDDDDSGTTGKKKDRAVRIGASIIEPKTAKTRQDEANKAGSLWDRLSGNDNKDSKHDETEKTDVESPEIDLKDKTDVFEATDSLPELTADAPEDEISSEEELPVRQAIVQELRTQDTEITNRESAEAIQAAQVAVERFRDRLNEGEEPDQAAAETLSEIGEVPLDLTTDTAEEPLVNAEGETAIIEQAIFEQPEAIQPVPEDESSTSNTSTGSVVPPIIPQQPSAGGGNGGMPPRGPGHSASAGTSPQPSGPGGFGGFNPNMMPTAQTLPISPNTVANPNTVPLEDALNWEQQAQNRGLLIGGIVGYLIGRRRGRIKTQKKLLPVQRKLEKQVKAMQADIISKEAVIRQAATHRAALRPPSAERVSQQAPLQKPETSGPQSSRRPRSAEAPRFQASSHRPERIGRVVISSESAHELTSSTSPERSIINATERPATSQFAEREVTTMSRAELLRLSEKIVIDGANLRQVYETHLVSERGLRRIVTEYLRGGDVKKQLRRELVEREIDFERDPILRDKARRSASNVSTNPTTSPQTLNHLLAAVGAAPGEDPETTVLVARAKHEQTQAAKRNQQRHLIDTGLAAIIVVLVILVVVFYTMHR